jgi:PPOX class probable F420-dependent enzyme
MSPVVAAVDDEGAVVISTRAGSAKVANLRRDPSASLCGLRDGFFGEWVRVDGPVEIVPLPEAMDGLIAVYRAVAGDHPDWAEFREAMEREERVLLRLTIAEVGPTTRG